MDVVLLLLLSLLLVLFLSLLLLLSSFSLLLPLSKERVSYFSSYSFSSTDILLVHYGRGSEPSEQASKRVSAAERVSKVSSAEQANE